MVLVRGADIFILAESPEIQIPKPDTYCHILTLYTEGKATPAQTPFPVLTPIP